MTGARRVGETRGFRPIQFAPSRITGLPSGLLHGEPESRKVRDRSREGASATVPHDDRTTTFDPSSALGPNRKDTGVSEQQPYGQPYGEPQPYGQVQAPPPPPGYGLPPVQQKTNTMSILGLVFAFLIPLLGIIFSAIGLKQTKERNEGGRGLAVTGLILSIIFTLIWVLLWVFVFAVGAAAVKQAGSVDAALSSASSAIASASNAQANDKGVADACNVIIPAASNSDLENASSVKQYQASIASLVATMQSAAAGTTDPAFIADVQKLVDDFNAASAAVGKGQDPSSLEGALTTDGSKVDQDCAAVGVSG